jgi:DNA (cytosine-5)-methyltransferase 1
MKSSRSKTVKKANHLRQHRRHESVATRKPIKYISCFSGIEAASVAWDELGWEPQAFCEIEPFPSAVLAERYPHVPNLGDITKVNWDEWKNKDIDLIIGGSPCQSFSVAGKRLGLDDARGNLAIEFIRIIDTVRPRWFILENVAGLLSSDGGRDFGALLALMGECGYGVAYRILDSQHFGVPQRRRRVFIIGHLGADWRYSAAALFESRSLQRNTPKALRIRSEEDASDSGEGFDSWSEGVESTSDSRRGITPDTYGIGGGQAAQWSAPAPDLAPTLHCQSDCALVAHEDPVAMSINSRDEIWLSGSDGSRTNTLTATDASRGGNSLVVQPDGKRMSVDTYNRCIDDQITPPLVSSRAFHQCVGEPESEVIKAWNFDAKSSNSMKSSNPDSGLQDITNEVAPTLTAIAPNPALNQGGVAIAQPPIGIEGNQACQLANTHSNEDLSATITAGNQPPMVGDPRPIGIEGNQPCQLSNTHSNHDLSATLTTTKTRPMVGDPSHPTHEMIVRKLTPLECERLQGFPDNWTRISWRGKPESECPDGHRYKACGNSMAVPVIRWLGERIEAVDAHVPTSPLPVEKSRIISDFKDGVVVAQDTMDEWFS